MHIEEASTSFLLIIFLLLTLILLAALILLNKNIKRKMANYQWVSVDSEIALREKIQSDLSMELHDGLGANISLAKLTISSLRLDNSLNKKQLAIINQSIEKLDETLKSIRYLSHQLSPINLKCNDSNLVEIIQHLRGLYNSNSKISFNTKIDTDYINLGSNENLNFYRIIQELAQNSLKHSGCSEIFLTINSKTNSLEVIYEDNGIFMLNNIQNFNGIGINNIKARIAILKGEIEFIKNKCLIVKMKLPYASR